MSQTAYLDCTLHLPGLGSARLEWAGRDYQGRPALDDDLAVTLRSLELEPEAYGRTLYDAVLPAGGELREGLREAIVAAEREKSRLRFLLRLAPDLPEWVHELSWELLTDHDRHLALARSPDTAFSRYLGVRQAPGTPTTRRPRLLCVVAAPSDLGRLGMAEIRRDEVVHRLADPFSKLAEAVDVTILEPPATLGRLRERLMADGGFHLLHVFGHGQRRGGASALILEDEEGRAQRVGEDLLAQAFMGVRELRLVTLVACHGGAASSDDPFSGLAGRLVQRGVPAVIAMRRAVSVEAAHLFTSHLYQHISGTGRADAAVNEARHQLYLADPKGIDWSSPVLYSRLTDGRLWLGPDAPPTAEEGTTAAVPPRPRLALERLRHPLPWLPALLCLLLAALGLWPAAEAEARLDLVASGLAFRLAAPAEVVERFELDEVAASRLAGLRLPPTLATGSRWAAPGPGGLRRFRLAAETSTEPRGRLTLQAPLLPGGTVVALERRPDDGERFYRLTLTDSDQELRVTFSGGVTLARAGARAVALPPDEPGSLLLVPQERAVAVDLAFARLAEDALAREIPVDRLELVRVEDRQTPETTMVTEASTLLAGEVEVRATGARHRLGQGERLRFTAVAGSLVDPCLVPEGIRFGFQGRVSGLERAPEGLAPERLMPSVLDLWIAGPAQLALQGAVAALAAAVLLATVLAGRPRAGASRPVQASSRPLARKEIS